MADIKVLYVNSDGLNQEHSETGDSIKMLSVKTANYTLTDALLGELVGGGDVSSAHTHSNLYFLETEFISSSTGSGDSGKPILLDGDGNIDATMLNDGDIDHDNIANNGTNSHATIDSHISDATIHFTEGSIDHGSIAGLSDDDHTIYILADGTRAFSGNQSMGSNKITNLADGTDANDAVNKGQLDSAVSGVSWKTPVDAFNLIGNATVATINGLSPTAGDQYVVTDTGTITSGSISANAGDIVEYTGTVWQRLIVGSGGFVPDGTRAVLDGTGTVTLISPYTDATDNDKIISFDGTSLTGVDTGETADAVSVLVQDPGHVSLYDNLGYVYEGTVPSGSWIQFTGVGQINAGDGLSKVGQTMNVNAGDGIVIDVDDVAVDLKASGGLKFDTGEVAVEPNDFAGNGLEDDGSDNLQLDLKSGGGLKFDTGEVAVEPNDFAGEGLIDDGADNMAIDWSTAFNDSKAVKASDLASTTNGFGASIIGIEDSGSLITATTVEGALAELAGNISAQGNIYTVGTGGVTKGDVVYISSANTVIDYDVLTQSHRAIGLAATTESAASTVKVLANDVLLSGLTIAGSPVAGDPIYWDGTQLTATIPSGAGSHVVQAGVLKDTGILHIECRHVKKNA